MNPNAHDPSVKGFNHISMLYLRLLDEMYSRPQSLEVHQAHPTLMEEVTLNRPELSAPLEAFSLGGKMEWGGW